MTPKLKALVEEHSKKYLLERFNEYKADKSVLYIDVELMMNSAEFMYSLLMAEVENLLRVLRNELEYSAGDNVEVKKALASWNNFIGYKDEKN